MESFDVTGGFRKNFREVIPEVAAIPSYQRKGKPAWRDGLPVDCSGQTPDGQAFSGIVEFAESSRETQSNSPAASRVILSLTPLEPFPAASIKRPSTTS